MNRRLIATCALLTVACSANAQQTPVMKFINHTADGRLVCHKVAFELIYQAEDGKRVDLHTPVDECIAQQKEAAKPLLKKALSTVASKPAAASAMKEYYLTWQSAMEELNVTATDTAMGWVNRQQVAIGHCREAVSRVKLETEL